METNETGISKVRSQNNPCELISNASRNEITDSDQLDELRNCLSQKPSSSSYETAPSQPQDRISTESIKVEDQGYQIEPVGPIVLYSIHSNLIDHGVIIPKQEPITYTLNLNQNDQLLSTSNIQLKMVENTNVPLDEEKSTLDVTHSYPETSLVDSRIEEGEIKIEPGQVVENHNLKNLSVNSEIQVETEGTIIVTDPESVSCSEEQSSENPTSEDHSSSENPDKCESIDINPHDQPTFTQPTSSYPECKFATSTQKPNTPKKADLTFSDISPITLNESNNLIETSSSSNLNLELSESGSSSKRLKFSASSDKESIPSTPKKLSKQLNISDERDQNLSKPSGENSERVTRSKCLKLTVGEAIEEDVNEESLSKLNDKDMRKEISQAVTSQNQTVSNSKSDNEGLQENSSNIDSSSSMPKKSLKRLKISNERDQNFSKPSGENSERVTRSKRLKLTGGEAIEEDVNEESLSKLNDKDMRKEISQAVTSQNQTVSNSKSDNEGLQENSSNIDSSSSTPKKSLKRLKISNERDQNLSKPSGENSDRVTRSKRLKLTVGEAIEEDVNEESLSKLNDKDMRKEISQAVTSQNQTVSNSKSDNEGLQENSSNMDSSSSTPKKSLKRLKISNERDQNLSKPIGENSGRVTRSKRVRLMEDPNLINNLSVVIEVVNEESLSKLNDKNMSTKISQAVTSNKLQQGLQENQIPNEPKNTSNKAVPNTKSSDEESELLAKVLNSFSNVQKDLQPTDSGLSENVRDESQQDHRSETQAPIGDIESNVEDLVGLNSMDVVTGTEGTQPAEQPNRTTCFETGDNPNNTHLGSSSDVSKKKSERPAETPESTSESEFIDENEIINRRQLLKQKTVNMVIESIKNQLSSEKLNVDHQKVLHDQSVPSSQTNLPLNEDNIESNLTQTEKIVVDREDENFPKQNKDTNKNQNKIAFSEIPELNSEPNSKDCVEKSVFKSSEASTNFSENDENIEIHHSQTEKNAVDREDKNLPKQNKDTNIIQNEIAFSEIPELNSEPISKDCAVFKSPEPLKSSEKIIQEVENQETRTIPGDSGSNESNVVEKDMESLHVKTQAGTSKICVEAITNEESENLVVNLSETPVKVVQPIDEDLVGLHSMDLYIGTNDSELDRRTKSTINLRLQQEPVDSSVIEENHLWNLSHLEALVQKFETSRNLNSRNKDHHRQSKVSDYPLQSDRVESSSDGVESIPKDNIVPEETQHEPEVESVPSSTENDEAAKKRKKSKDRLEVVEENNDPVVEYDCTETCFEEPLVDRRPMCSKDNPEEIIVHAQQKKTSPKSGNDESIHIEPDSPKILILDDCEENVETDDQESEDQETQQQQRSQTYAIEKVIEIEEDPLEILIRNISEDEPNQENFNTEARPSPVLVRKAHADTTVLELKSTEKKPFETEFICDCTAHHKFVLRRIPGKRTKHRVTCRECEEKWLIFFNEHNETEFFIKNKYLNLFMDELNKYRHLL